MKSKELSASIKAARSLGLTLTSAQKMVLESMPKNHAMRVISQMGGATNTKRVRWAYRANGTINFSKTARNMHVNLTNAQRMVLESLPKTHVKSAMRQIIYGR